jgi:hypothetical protein
MSAFICCVNLYTILYCTSARICTDSTNKMQNNLGINCYYEQRNSAYDSYYEARIHMGTYTTILESSQSIYIAISTIHRYSSFPFLHTHAFNLISALIVSTSYLRWYRRTYGSFKACLSLSLLVDFLFLISTGYWCDFRDCWLSFYFLDPGF